MAMADFESHHFGIETVDTMAVYLILMSLNRTTLELKRITGIVAVDWSKTLNRTTLELKLVASNMTELNPFFESHHFGIETCCLK